MDNYKFPFIHIQAVVLLNSCDIFSQPHSDRREPKSGACIHFFHGVAQSQGDFLKIRMKERQRAGDPEAGDLLLVSKELCAFQMCHVQPFHFHLANGVKIYVTPSLRQTSISKQMPDSPLPPQDSCLAFKRSTLSAEFILATTVWGYPKAYRINKFNIKASLCRVIAAISIPAVLVCPPSLSEQ